MNKTNATTQFAVKRLLVGLFDAVTLLVMAILALPAFTEAAWAYVDPSVMTYTIQALAGVAVALSAVAGVAFRRTRKALLKALKIDENANKEIDAKWVRLSGEEEYLTQGLDYFKMAEEQVTSVEGEHALSKDKRDSKGLVPWAKRFGLALVVSVFCGFTLGVIAPFETVAGATADLYIRLEDIAPTMLLFSAFCAFALAAVLSAFRGKAYVVLVALTFSLGLCCYVQAMALNAGLPSADGSPVDWWGSHSTMMIVSTLVWLAIIAAVQVVCHLKERATLLGVMVLSLALVVVQGAGVASLVWGEEASSQSGENGIAFITEDGLLELSPTNNVVVFVLDMYDTRDLQLALEEDPHLLDEMRGFTWYQDSAGMMLPTKLAVPYLFTQETPVVGENFPDYLVRRYEEGSFLEDLDSTGFSVGVYTDGLEEAYLSDKQAHADIFVHLDNAHSLSNRSVNRKGTIRSLSKCALYRDMPWIVKGLFRFYTDDINRSCVEYSEGDAPEQTIWVTDDVAYYDKLQQQGLSFENKVNNGAFRFIHLKGPHWPYTLNADAIDVGEGNSTRTEQARGSIHIVEEYLNEMRKLGVYDNATIIITADHGDWASSLDLPVETTSPIMLVKTPDAGDSPLQVSHARISHADYHASVLKATGFEDYHKYGNSFDEIDDSGRIRDFYQITSDGRHVLDVVRYTIDGDVLDFANWTVTEDRWDAQEVER